MLSAGYTFSDALTDALAGFTVALCVIPQSIAMAIIAELPPHVSFVTKSWENINLKSNILLFLSMAFTHHLLEALFTFSWEVCQL